MKKYLIFAVLTIILSACAGYMPPNIYNKTESNTVNVNFDTAFKRVIEFFKQNGTPIETPNYQAGTVSTKWLDLGAYSWAYIDCGRAQNSDAYNKYGFDKPQIAYTITVESIDANRCSISVKVKAFCEYYRKSEFKTEQKIIDCESNGELEKLILNSLRDKN
jgi:hypothetical protein